ncbi:hypothetical protein DFH29DRAFT_1069597, partial [Suillus ampliporus]
MWMIQVPAGAYPPFVPSTTALVLFDRGTSLTDPVVLSNFVDDEKALAFGGAKPREPSFAGASGEGSNRPLSHMESRKGLLPKLRDKLANRSARSARQSPNPEPAAASTSAQDLMHTGTTQDPSFTAPTPEPNPGQSSSACITNAEQPDTKSVNKRIIDATKGVAGMENVTGIVENTASAPNNLQSVSDAINTFSPILAPLKVFNSIAERLAD